VRRARTAAGCLGAVLAAACGGGGGGGGPRPPEPPAFVAQDRASVEPSPEEAATTAEAGAFAADYLRGSHFTTLVVEVDHPESRPPDLEALDFLRARLLERCDKLDVLVVVDDAIPDDRFPLAVPLATVHEIEDEHRDLFSDEATATAAAYVLYVKGSSTFDTPQGKVLGLTHRGGSLALFVSSTDASESSWYSKREYEAHTLVHEFGHLLGLVAAGVPMVDDHRDPFHPFHTSDVECVMFWVIGRLGSPSFGEPEFARFGPHCAADTAAFGGL
jgi:hypothetical protein